MNNCYVSLGGGLGNQLFQIAAGFSYAKKYKKTLYLFSKHWSGSQGQHPDTYRNSIFQNFNIVHHIPEKYKEYHELRFNYDEIPYEKGSIMLHGYFQSLKYFEDVKSEFIELLKFKPLDTSFIEDDAVAVHVRRGDYLQHRHIHLVCDTSYFLENIKGFKQVNIFTDSFERTKEEFSETDVNYIKSNSELSDLYLMSCHDNIICSNSSFSWWASLLGKEKKTIVVPKIWFKQFEEHYDIYRKDFTISEI